MPTREPREITESFRIERVLKSSRSGIVFRAHEPATGESVAIKLIPSPPAAVVAPSQARFMALAELLTLLQPPGFPPLRDFGFTPDGGAFLVMDLVEGTRLDRVADLTPARAVAITLRVVEALATLARKGLYHGNISPDNVLVGTGDSIWVVGLGSAAFAPAGMISHAILGDAAAEFAAPECFAAEGALVAMDWRADLYSLALTLCTILSAEVGPADADAPTVQLPFGVVAALNDPDELRVVLEHSLRRAAPERPGSLDAVRDALRRALGEDTAAAGTGQQPGRGPAQPEDSAGGQRSESPPPPVRPGPQSPDVVPAPPASTPVAAGDLEWEQPEGAPGWLQESQMQIVAQAPEPRSLESAPAPARDEREDTNPVPLLRRAELPLMPTPVTSLPAPTVGAPSPLPTPVIAPAPPPTAPPLLPAAPVPAAASPVVPQPPAASRPEPPRAVAAGPGPAAAPPVPQPPRAMEATPPTGSYELAGGVKAPAVPVPPTNAQAASPAVEEAPSRPEAEPATPAAPVPDPSVAPKVATPATAKAPSRGTGRRTWPLIAAAAALVVVVAGAIIGLRMTTSSPTAVLAPSPVPTRPRPTAVPQPTISQAALESLLAAEEAAAAGDAATAQAALARITANDELSFGPAELGRLTSVRSSLNQRRREGILAELQQGLTNGNLRVVRDTLRRMTREDEAALGGDPDAAQTLEEARRAINLLNLATKAQQAGNNAQALEHASALVALAPRSSQAEELREKAAAGLERDAETLAGRGQFELAQERLDTLARHWSDRPGIAQRVERVRAAEANDQKLASLLAQAEQMVAGRQPDRGLELLRSVSPPPYYEQRFRDARQRLEEVLREIDANPPDLDIPATARLEYSKNKPFVLVVRITDDHAVKSAALFLRVKDAVQYKELALRRTQDDEWTGEITTALHENKAVEFYVVATDHSGHTGQLAGPQQPLTLKKKWGIFGR
jgi:serine/threonine protein kinase